MTLRRLPSPTSLIFDMDGVLVDSEPLHKRAKEEAFREFGILLPESVYDSYKGRPDETIMGEVFRQRGGSGEKLAELLRLKHRIFESIEHEMRPVPGAVDFLLWAADRYRIALATSATPRNRTVALESLGVSHLFQMVVDSDCFQRPKPDPEVFLVAIRGLGLTPADCWVIEDSVNGVQAAKSAGCVAVGITTTFESAVLMAAGADAVVDSFAEFRDMLEQS